MCIRDSARTVWRGAAVRARHHADKPRQIGISGDRVINRGVLMVGPLVLIR